MEPQLCALVDQTNGDIRQALKMLGEDDKAFQQRQKRSWQAFDRFVERISRADARIILDDFSWGGFDAIVARNPAVADGWKRSLLAVQDGVFRAMHAFATGLARALAPTDPVGAAQLFARTAAQRPFVNRVIGLSGIPSEAAATCSLGPAPVRCSMRAARPDATAIQCSVEGRCVSAAGGADRAG